MQTLRSSTTTTKRDEVSEAVQIGMNIKCLLINGSARADAGNSAMLLRAFQHVALDFETRTLNLVDAETLADALPSLQWAEVLVLATGTYWDSWGWPLQRFLEQATITEGSATWLGKPVGVLVTMHSVGGKSVLSRLQGVLNTFGAMIPPMSGCVISAVGQAAMTTANPPLCDDIWCIDDLNTIAANLKCAHERRSNYQSWNVDRASLDVVWIET